MSTCGIRPFPCADKQRWKLTCQDTGKSVIFPKPKPMLHLAGLACNLHGATESTKKRVKSTKIKTHFCAVFGPCAVVVGLFVTVEDSQCRKISHFCLCKNSRWNATKQFRSRFYAHSRWHFVVMRLVQWSNAFAGHRLGIHSSDHVSGLKHAIPNSREGNAQKTPSQKNIKFCNSPGTAKINCACF